MNTPQPFARNGTEKMYAALGSSAGAYLWIDGERR